MLFLVFCFGLLWAFPFIFVYMMTENMRKRPSKSVRITISAAVPTMFSGGLFSLVNIVEKDPMCLLLGWVVCPAVGAIIVCIYFSNYISKH